MQESSFLLAAVFEVGSRFRFDFTQCLSLPLTNPIYDFILKKGVTHNVNHSIDQSIEFSY